MTQISVNVTLQSLSKPHHSFLGAPNHILRKGINFTRRGSTQFIHNWAALEEQKREQISLFFSSSLFSLASYFFLFSSLCFPLFFAFLSLTATLFQLTALFQFFIFFTLFHSIFASSFPCSTFDPLPIAIHFCSLRFSRSISLSFRPFSLFLFIEYSLDLPMRFHSISLSLSPSLFLVSSRTRVCVLLAVGSGSLK